MRHFNEIFRKNVTYDNIWSHKKPGFQPLFRRYFLKNRRGEGQIEPPSCFRVNLVNWDQRNPRLLHPSNLIFFPSLKWQKTKLDWWNGKAYEKYRSYTLREKSPNPEFYLVHVFPFLDWMRENTDQKNSVLDTFHTVTEI